MLDKIKIALAALLVVAGLGGFYYLADLPAISRVGSVLVGMVAAAFVFWTTDPGKQFYVYAQESIAETKKVVWPTRRSSSFPCASATRPSSSRRWTPARRRKTGCRGRAESRRP